MSRTTTTSSSSSTRTSRRSTSSTIRSHTPRPEASTTALAGRSQSEPLPDVMSSVTSQVAHAFEDASPLSKPQRGVGSSASNVIEFPVRRKYDGQLESDIVLPLATDDEVASAIIRLARRNEALEDFAALVAHELKTPLQAALLAD